MYLAIDANHPFLNEWNLKIGKVRQEDNAFGIGLKRNSWSYLTRHYFQNSKFRVFFKEIIHEEVDVPRDRIYA